MSQLGKLTIAVVRNLGRMLRARGVVVLALDDDNIVVGTWGKRKRDCEDMARLGDNLMDAIQHGIFSTWRKRNAAGKIVREEASMIDEREKIRSLRKTLMETGRWPPNVESKLPVGEP